MMKMAPATPSMRSRGRIRERDDPATILIMDTVMRAERAARKMDLGDLYSIDREITATWVLSPSSARRIRVKTVDIVTGSMVTPSNRPDPQDISRRQIFRDKKDFPLF